MSFISHKPDRTWIYQISFFLLKSIRIRLKKLKFSASRRTYQFFKNSGSSFIIFTGLLISTVPTIDRTKEKSHNNIKNSQQNKIEKITTKTKIKQNKKTYNKSKNLKLTTGGRKNSQQINKSQENKELATKQIENSQQK